MVAALAFAAGVAWAGSAADPRRGVAIYERCAGCHSLTHDRAGPRHCGLFGRRAGSLAGFEYSEAMKRSAITWNERSLDRFLAAPMTAIPGTSMGYAGIGDARERADLIAYLESASTGPDCPGTQGRVRR